MRTLVGIAVRVLANSSQLSCLCLPPRISVFTLMPNATNRPISTISPSQPQTQQLPSMPKSRPRATSQPQTQLASMSSQFMRFPTRSASPLLVNSSFAYSSSHRCFSTRFSHSSPSEPQLKRPSPMRNSQSAPLLTNKLRRRRKVGELQEPSSRAVVGFAIKDEFNMTKLYEKLQVGWSILTYIYFVNIKG